MIDLESLLRAVGREPSAAAPDACIDDGELIAYREYALPEDRMHQIDLHLLCCPPCRALMRGIADPVPDALLARMADAVPGHEARSKWRPAWIALAGAALAAGTMLVVLAPWQLAETVPAYEVEGPFGGRKTVRSERIASEAGGVGAETAVFAPQSTVKFVLRPARDLEGPAPALRAFVAAHGAPLVAAPRAAIRVGEGGAFRFEIEAGALFGNGAGPQTVYLVVAADESALDALAGQPAQDARAQLPSARWYTYDMRYEVSAAERRE